MSVKLEESAPKFGVRHLQIILLFFLIAIAYGSRTNLSVGIVAMTDPTVNPEVKTYKWSNKSVILSSFFWGYIVPQILAGQLAKNYGAKWFLVLSMMVNSIFIFLTPFMADFGSWGVIVCRIIEGLSQGFFFPSVHNLLGKWVPLRERSRFGTFVYAASSFGTVISMPLTGWISSYSSWGWPLAFYIYAIFGAIWTVFWIIFGFNSPSDCPYISDEEIRYIEYGLEERNSNKNPTTPWLEIWTSLPVWAVILAHCGHNWGYATFLTEVPTYMAEILNFDIKENALLSGCPYLIFWIMSFVFSFFADLLINRKILGVGVARKIFNSIGLYGPALSLLILCTIHGGGDAKSMTLILIFTSIAINSASFSGFQVNHIDLSPNHAGTLMGITNAFANIFAILAPLTVQYIVVDDTDETQWEKVFFICCAIYIIGNTLFIFLGSGKVQSWDSDTKNNEQNPEQFNARSNISIIEITKL